MKLTLSPRTQRFVAVGLLALLVALLFEVILWPLWSSASEHGERVAVLKRQAATMEGLAAAAPDFETAAKKLAANPDAQQLTLAGPQATLAVAQLQAQLAQLLQSAPAVLMSSQSMPEAKEGALTKISVQISFETDMKGLVKALHSVGAARPLLQVGKITVLDPDGDWTAAAAANANANAPNKLRIDMVVAAYMRGP